MIPDCDLSSEISKLRLDGYRIVNMFMEEPVDDKCTIDTILRKGNEIKRLVTEIADRRFESVSVDNPSAEIYERLMREYNGCVIDHLGNETPVTYWRAGNPPMVKDRPAAQESRVPIPHNNIQGDGIFEIPVGPVHAGVIEPGHFRFSVAGESVIKLSVHLGYTHRGIEKLLEVPVQRNMIHLIERTAGDTTVANSLAYCHLIENDVPERAKFVRVIAAELERLAYNVSSIGGVCTDTAFSVPAAFGSRLHEDVLRISKKMFGDRFIRNVIVPGGVRKDISDDKERILVKSLIALKLDIMELEDMMLSNSTLMDRLETTGILKKEIAEKYGAVGPIARASGIASDVRKEVPYDGYVDTGMLVATETTGDVLARTKVRIRETYESIDLIFQAISLMSPGKLKNDVATDDGFKCSVVEAPRGELVHCANVIDGRIWRYSIRDPSLVNWPMMSYAVPGNVVPDFPLINKSFSLAYSGNDL